MNLQPWLHTAQCNALNSTRTAAFIAALVATSLLGLGLSGAARAQDADLTEVSKLLRQGQLNQAMERVEKVLASKPRDAQARFLRGLILTEQNKTADAIDVFTRLTQDYPELPEPYNNLAVLYASQGQYEKARQALEMSIRTHPSYATAYENLGDVYARLASQAYDKALQLDSGNSAAKSKLSLIRDLMGNTTRAPRAPARSNDAKAAPAAEARDSRSNAATASNAKPAATPAPSAATPVAPAAATATSSAAATAASSDSKAGKDQAKAAAAAPSATEEEVLKAVRAWASAWSKKETTRYLAYYAKDFKTPNGESRADWEAARKQRINGPKSIEVLVESPKVSVKDENHASVSFRQSYRSDSLKINSGKTLVLVRVDGRWLIVQERVGG
jgi:tetratricopeptide (TPR) repeat protein